MDDITTNTWVTPSYTGPYACPATCETSDKQCNSPDFVFSFTKTDDDTQSFKLRLYADELFTINLENMDPGKIGCATTQTPGSNGVLGQLEPTSTSVFKTNLDAKPFKLVECSLNFDLLHSFLPLLPSPVTKTSSTRSLLVC